MHLSIICLENSIFGLFESDRFTQVLLILKKITNLIKPIEQTDQDQNVCAFG